MSVESIRVTVVRSRARRVASSLSREASGSWQHSYNIAIWLTKSLSSCNEKLSQQWYDYLSTANLASPFQDSSLASGYRACRFLWSSLEIHIVVMAVVNASEV
jgi:hypothetical protein